MRKYIIGAIVGAFLAYSGQAMAETISNVGKKIQAEYIVVVDGKALSSKAVAVNGTTLTPNRALADAVGYDVVFKNNEVLFTKKDVNPVSNPIIDDGKSVSSQISEIDEKLRLVNDSLAGSEWELERAKTDTQKASLQKIINERKATIADLKAKKAALEAQQ